ncbi:hypothetical protein ACGF1Z_12535 [Streptomyces sp. NPDC048018]|uniref:hypothetical protein n=1 Tax=Streptomyces sp. NPDC048018 TaxID=3365499 RepID=UPI00371E9DCD
MDVEEVADELYGLKPTEFVAARDAYAAEARKAGDKEAAKVVSALRRPTVAAWAANLLARRRPEEARRFLEIGETLREAHRTLDAEQLSAASRQRNQLVGALTRTAAGLARDEGQTVGDTVLHEIDQTLRSVLADPETAETWVRGRLVRVPEAAVDFTAVAPASPPARRKRAAPSAPEPRQDRALARARAKAAEDEVRRREQELAEARTARRSAEAHETAATDRLAALEHELAQARGAAHEAKAATASAGKAVKGAEAALAKARRAAELAAREARNPDLEKPEGT